MIRVFRGQGGGRIAVNSGNILFVAEVGDGTSLYLIRPFFDCGVEMSELKLSEKFDDVWFLIQPK